MKNNYCVNQDGEDFIIFQNNEGMYCCPVCGSPELTEAPYDENGSASFQMCSCNFEFGYDSQNGSKEAVEGREENWKRWRLKVIEKCSHSKKELEHLENTLENLGIYLAFDLIPVKRNENT